MLELSNKLLSNQSFSRDQHFSPDLGEVPELDIPVYLPDLPGVADISFDQTIGSIAPSLPSIGDVLPDLPDIGVDVPNVASAPPPPPAAIAAPPPPPPSVPGPPPPPAPAAPPPPPGW